MAISGTGEGLTNANVREFNKRSILQLFREKRNLTKRDVAIALDLSIPTVSQIVDELIDDGFVSEMGSFSSTGGRKPKCYAFIPSAKLSVGVEIANHSVRMVLLDLCTNQLGRKVLNLSFEETPAYWEALSEQINRFVDSFFPKENSILGIGIAFPGSMSRDGRHLEHIMIKKPEILEMDTLARLLGHPVRIVNSGNAAGFAELWHANHFSHMFYLSIGKSISGALMFNNELYSGFDNRAGAVAHNIIVADNGKPCACGNTGCFEAYCSTRNLTEPFNCSLEDFFRCLRLEEDAYVRVWNEYIRYLAVELKNIRLLLDMSIVIGGELSDYLSDYMSHLRAELARIGVDSKRFSSFLTLSHYHGDAAAIGAALCPIDQFINA